MHAIPHARAGLVAALLIAGCGARTQALDDYGPADGAPAADGAASASPTGTATPTATADPASAPDDAAGTPFTVCPSDPPVAGSVCDSAGLHCVYEDRNTCQVFECSHSSGWQPSHEGC